MFYAWALPMFTLLGVVGGLAVRRLNPTTRRWFVGFWLARVLLGLTAALLLVGYAIAESRRPAGSDRAYLVPAILLFVTGAVFGMVRTPRASVSRRRRVVQPAGSYVVPPGMRPPMPPPPPIQFDDRPLPKPFNPGDH